MTVSAWHKRGAEAVQGMLTRTAYVIRLGDGRYFMTMWRGEAITSSVESHGTPYESMTAAVLVTLAYPVLYTAEVVAVQR